MRLRNDYYKAHRLLRQFKNRQISTKKLDDLCGKVYFDSYYAAIKAVL